MATKNEDSDEEYFTPNEDDTSEVPGCRLQQASGENCIYEREDETMEVSGRRLSGTEAVAPGSAFFEASGENYIYKREDETMEVSGRRLFRTEDIRLLLVGKTGHGKSATANSILRLQKGQDGSFYEKTSSLSVTEVAERKKGLRFGRAIEVVDSPGFCDTKLTENQIKEAVLKAITLTLPGFSAVGFVLRPDRFSEELVQAVEHFIEIFGDKVKNFLFIILTHTQDEEAAKQYFTDCHESLEKLKRLCSGGKIVLIDNACKEEGKKDQQVQNIIDAIDSIKRKNGDTFFSNQSFEEATSYALNCIPIQSLAKTDATSDDDFVQLRLEMFKERIENDTNGALSDFLEYLRENKKSILGITLVVSVALMNRNKCSLM